MPAFATTAIATAAGAPLLLGAAAGGWVDYTVHEGDTVWDIAASHRTDVRTIVRANHLSNGGHLIRTGSTIRVPGVAPARHAKPAPKRRPAPTARYKVRAGDTVSHIALRLGVSISTVLKANHLDRRGRIYAGQYLTVPAQPVKAQAKAAKAAAAGTVITRYTVRSGDTVSAIAVRLHSTVAGILKANRIRATTRIHPGQRLSVPVRRAVRPAASANTFAGRTYSDAVVGSAAANRARLASRAVPSRSATRTLIESTARRYGVDPALAVAVAYQESGWNQRQVSVANAIGVMQVIPASGAWASSLVGRHLDLLDTRDNVTAGVVILKSLARSAKSTEQAVAGYYQGLASVRKHGMYVDTKAYVRSITALRRQFA